MRVGPSQLNPSVLRAQRQSEGFVKNGHQTRQVLRVGALVLAGVMAAALVLAGVDWATGKILAPRVERTFRAVALLRPGMERADVERVLAVNAPHLMKPSEIGPGIWSAHFSYTLMEACYITLEFGNARLVGVGMSDANQPGHCPGAPVDWDVAEGHARPRD